MLRTAVWGDGMYNGTWGALGLQKERPHTETYLTVSPRTMAHQLRSHPIEIKDLSERLPESIQSQTSSAGIAILPIHQIFLHPIDYNRY